MNKLRINLMARSKTLYKASNIDDSNSDGSSGSGSDNGGNLIKNIAEKRNSILLTDPNSLIKKME